MAEACNASKPRSMTWKVPVARGDASHYGKPTFERQSPDDASRRGHVRAPDRCLTRPRAGSRSPLFPRPPRRPRQGSSRRARDRVRDVRLSVPLLPLLRPHHHAAPGKGIRADGGSPRGCGARRRRGRRQHAHVLHRRRVARRGGPRRGVPGRPGLGLPQQDDRPGAVMEDRPSFIYRLSVRLAERALPLAARFDKKIARGVDARRGVLERLAAWGRAQRDPKRPLVWVHAPSVGEGLQAKPVLESLRAEQPQWQLVYTFFSPSAERLARTLPVDFTDYLPLDRPRHVAAALEALRPAALVFAKLDVWPELTLAAARRGVKLGLISATVAPDSSRLRWPARRWAEAAYRALDRIGAISEEDGRRLQQLGARREAIEVTGDTRYDSVAERAERFDRTREPFARLAVFPAGTFTLVAGSTWPADEAVVLPAFVDLLAQVPAARLVLAPHEPNPDHLALIAERAQHLKLPRPVRLSQLEHGAPSPVT